ncbi:NDMA-dependent alcohol dehydrogenase [Mycobacterium conspicuum]|uniref:alcohol dehydrogenase n=1 Tax=Mycobacterium conspicuum TaxID=44010 RepID=A0A1X1TMZ9_9MYCO|nr:NDMA-dependent alcohol dehydrogenase [Mycobacterium conspicuum]ORV45906.1 alcohol dehydrogenase [Mycobacterium conspicuum]BBZ38835.1 alcohol dehydrogenase [Mycobacterium conspicuum]
MKCQAAVLRGVGKDWEVCEIELDEPRRGEVLVRMVAASVCHTDDHFATGDAVPAPEMIEVMRAAGMETPDWFPLIGGHEGAGIVEQVGPDVRGLKPGDHVGMSFIPACGKCRWCVSGQSYVCDVGANLFSKQMITDGTVRRHLGQEDLMATTQLGTFAEYLVASEDSLIKVDDSIPFHAVSLVSCGVTTGWGSATVSAGTQPGDTVVVIGLGGVGMNALQGAHAAGAKYIVGVDPVDFKRDSAKLFGATHTARWAHEAIELVRELTAGVMADRVVLTAGVVHADLIPVAMMLTRKAGTCVLTGMTPLSEMSVPLILVDMAHSAKQLKGTIFGEMNPRASMPMLLSMYQAGALKLDELVTRRYRLEQINEAIDDLREGRNIRGLIDFPSP